MAQKDDYPQVFYRKPSGVSIEIEIKTIRSLTSIKGRAKEIMRTPHQDHFFALLFIRGGTGSHFVDFQNYSLQPGSLLILTPGQVHGYTDYDRLDGFAVFFTNDFLTKNMIQSDLLAVGGLHTQADKSSLMDLEAAAFGPLCGLVETMGREFRDHSDFAAEEILRSYLKILLLKIERLIPNFPAAVPRSARFYLFLRFKQAAELSVFERKTVQEIADELGVSTKHLNEVCRDHSGQTVKKYVDALMVLNIKRQLVVSDISVKELSYRFNFDETTNFIKYFRRFVGMTPSEFRRSLLSP